MTSGNGPEDIESGKLFDTSLVMPGDVGWIPLEFVGGQMYDVVHPDEDPSPFFKNVGNTQKDCPNVTIEKIIGQEGDGTNVPTEETPQEPPKEKEKEPPKEKEKEKKQVNIKYISILQAESVSEESKGYDPKDYSAAAGSLVFWRNNDYNVHMVVSGNLSTGPTGIFNSGWIKPGGMFNIVGQSGTHEYYCALHPHMKGTLNIK